MHRGGALLVGLLVLAVGIGPAPVAAEPLQNATVFAVVGDDRNASDPLTANRYRAVAGDPDRAVALIPATGSQDVLLYRNRTFRTYGFGTRNIYLDAAWRPGGSPVLAGVDPVDRVSRLWSFSPDGVREAVTTNVTIQAVDVGPGGRTLAVGGTARNGTGFVLAVDENGTGRTTAVPTGAPLRDVAWHPSGAAAVVAGVRGALYRYRNGSLRRVDSVGDAFLTGVAWRADGDGILAVGATGTNGSRPSGDGVVFSGTTDGVVPLARFDEPLRDVSWRPGGGYGLAVGGQASPAIHAVRADGSVRTHALDATPTAVDWYTADDAIVVGGDRIWRYALSTDPEGFPPTASLTVTPPRPSPGTPFGLVAYGSTADGSADAITSWRFAVGENVTEWRRSSVLAAQFRRAGRYTVGVRARSRDGDVSAWRNATVTVGDPGGLDGGRPRPTDGRPSPPVWILMALTGVVLVLALAVSWIRAR